MILAERITDKLRSFYRRQEPFDVGERPRLGIDETRARADLRPHTGLVEPSTINAPAPLDTAERSTATGG